MRNGKKEKGKWLSLQGAVCLCRKHGRNITKTGLIHIGKELDFIRRDVGGFHWEYEKSKLLKYLKNAIVPVGWISMEHFACRINSTIGMAYYILRKYQLKYRKYGKLRGIIHVKEKDAITAYQKHRGIDNVGKEKT